MLERTLTGIASNRYDLSNMMTHRFNPDETHKAFELVRTYSDGVMKAIIEF